jgi:TetR/AcrR family transcriptional regulator, ethionamide resistance regulator
MEPATSSPPRRIRRRPADATREILDAAAQILTERPFRELSVDDLMARTGMKRSSFYHYFSSVDEVAIALMRRVQGEMMDAAAPWIRPDFDGDPAFATTRGIHAAATIFARHGRVLAAIHEASFHHDTVQQVWRDGVVVEWINAITEQLRVQRAHGHAGVDDPEAVARSLVLMNTAVFVERLGKVPPDNPDTVAGTLAQIWVATLYPDTRRPSVPSPEVGQAPALPYLAGILDQGFRRELRRRLVPFDLAVSECTVLSVVECRPGLSAAELARRSLIRPQSMQVVVETLDKRGLVERHEDPSHGRILQIRVTPSGRDLLSRVKPIVDALQDEVLRDVPARDRDIVRRSLSAGIERLTETARERS